MRDRELTHLLSYAAFDAPSGHVLNWRDDTQWFLNARKAVQAKMPGSGTVALLDSTTVTNAVSILHPNTPLADVPAGALLDLASFATAYVLEDHLIWFHDQGRLPQLVIETFGPTAPLEFISWQNESPFDEVLANLWSAAESTTSHMCSDREWQPILRSWWMHALGKDIPADFYRAQGNYRKYYSSVTSKAMQEGIVTTDRARNWSAAPRGLWLGQDEDFAAEATVRTVFYQHCGMCMDVSYYASTHRAQIRALLDSGIASGAANPNHAILGFVQKEFWRATVTDATSLLDSPPLQLPIVLFAALARARTLRDVVEQLQILRSKAQLFRSRRAELTDAFTRGNVTVLASLSRAVGAEAKALSSLKQFAGGNAWLRGILSVGGARPILGALGFLVAHFLKLPDEVQTVLKARFVRPEFWFMVELGAAARETLKALPVLMRLLSAKGYSPGDQELTSLTRELERLTTPWNVGPAASPAA